MVEVLPSEPCHLIRRTPLADKILTRGRGGFCYELNGLFGRLLESLGYRVTLLGAQVWTGERFGPPLDHLALVVSPGDEEQERWLADVGFGDHSVYPLPWRAGTDLEDPGGVFRLEPAPSGDLDVYRDGKPQYRLDPHPRVLADFEAMCWYQAHSPGSHFTRSLVCSRRTPDGRVTLSGRRLVTTTAAGRDERELGDDGAVLEAYRRVFGITLERVPPEPD